MPGSEGWVLQFEAAFFHRAVPGVRGGVRVYISAYTKDYLHAGALGALRTR